MFVPQTECTRFVPPKWCGQKLSHNLSGTCLSPTLSGTDLFHNLSSPDLSGTSGTGVFFGVVFAQQFEWNKNVMQFGRSRCPTFCVEQACPTFSMEQECDHPRFGVEQACPTVWVEHTCPTVWVKQGCPLVWAEIRTRVFHSGNWANWVLCCWTWCFLPTEKINKFYSEIGVRVVPCSDAGGGGGGLG